MDKSRDAFRTISEVADWLGTPTHVLRFWESRFSQVKPTKRAGKRRHYRPEDMELLGGIKKLLHNDGLTIRGVQKILREEGIKSVAALSQPVDGRYDEHIEKAGFAQDVEPEVESATVVSITSPDAAMAAVKESEAQAAKAESQSTAERDESPGDSQTGLASDLRVQPDAPESIPQAEPDTAEDFAGAVVEPELPESAALPKSVSTPGSEATPFTAPEPESTFGAPSEPEPDLGPSIAEEVLAALRARPSADPAKLKPFHNRLTALRARIAQDQPAPSS